MRLACRYVFACFCCVTLLSAEISPELFNGLKWRLIGPFRGGRAVAVSGVPGGGSTFYFGSVDGGIWKTIDAGVVWTPIFDSQPVGSIGALEVAPSDANVIYVGTGESDIRSDLASGDGVYKSTDAGKTWRNVGLKNTRQISRIVVDPRDPNVVFVAALGHAYAPNDDRGVFVSRNGGETWDRVLERGPKVGAADLAIAPDAPDVLFAAMWEAHRPPWSTYAPLAGPGSGLFRSTDGGRTWQQLTGNGLPGGELGRIGLAIARGTQGKRIYATIEAKQGGLYRSDDGGNIWALVNNDPRLTSRAWYFSCITVDPNDPDVLYVPNVALYKLTDGGKTISILRGAPGGDDYHQIWIDPANSRHMVLGTDQGTTVSLDRGVTWSSWYNQPTAQFYHVVTDNDFPYHVYGAQQDSGTAATASRTDHGEIDLRDWFTVGGSESGYIAIDPNDPNIFYVSGTYGSLGRFDRRTGQNQNIQPYPMPSGINTEIAARKYRDPWTPVLVFSPVAPHALYFGTQYVMKTLDGGLHWQTISPDLTGAKPHASEDTSGPVSVDNAEQRGYGVVYTIAPSPLSASEIWAGSDTGLIHITRDAGKTWSDVTPPTLTAWSKITQIEASHFSPGEAWAAVDRHRLDDMRPYLYRTRDFGKTWTPVVDGIADRAFLNAIREDPKRKGLLFAGTEFGVYVSFDDGGRWLPLQLNLPVTSIRDIAVHGDDLIVATHGRSFWVLDDMDALRQINPDSAAQSALLYKPARAIRMAVEGFSGTPLPPEEPQAQNPPRGAYIDYFLPAAAGDVKLEILDGNGKKVREFSSAQHPHAAANAGGGAIAPRWIPKPEVLSNEPGMHRYIWDLHYGPTTQTQSEEEAGFPGRRGSGPWVLPGLYKVNLTVDGTTLSQLLEVAMDPRSHVTRADLIEQFRWARKAFDDGERARKASAELRSFQIQLSKDKAHLGSDQGALTAAIAQANEKANRIATGPSEESNEGLQYATRGVAAALSAIESADRPPTSQAIALYLECSKTLRARLADWTALKQNVVPALNEKLQRSGLAPIQIAAVEEAADESEAQ